MTPLSNAERNLSYAALIEHAVKRGEGMLSNHGAFVAQTGKYTGRSPNDKFTVQDSSTQDNVWWGPINQPMMPEVAEKLYRRIEAYLAARPQIFVEDCFAGTSPEHRLSVRVVTERAWHAAFAKNMFLQPNPEQLAAFSPQFTVMSAPGFKASPAVDGTRSEAAIVVDYSKKRVLICGTEYAGEIKKSVFTLLNYLLPEKGILGMHCSANVGKDERSALFFGLSGTGKTTLSADPERSLVGDDEHGWSDEGVFNFEGGCYAKVIRLSAKDEPEIFATTQRFGTILENVVMDVSSRALDLNDAKYTENTRASYDISQIPNALMTGKAPHPTNIVMLACDAFGVLPPLSKLTPAQAVYHFLSGYTARVAGTERGVTEPTAVFSACFGAPFMARHPTVYAKILHDRIEKHGAHCWLVNTGWIHGPYGTGKRISIAWTRALLHAVLSGALVDAKFKTHSCLGLNIPTEVDGVPSEILDPRAAWEDKEAYDKAVANLTELFKANFRNYKERVIREVADAGPN
jgi:phosphoenolpyruvate carboxykinase (ATP)